MPTDFIASAISEIVAERGTGRRNRTAARFDHPAYRSSIGAELSAVAKYYDRAIAFAAAADAHPHSLDSIDCREKLTASDVESLSGLAGEHGKRTLIVIGVEEHRRATIRPLLRQLRAIVGRETRVALISVHGQACALPPGWEEVRVRHTGYIASELFGVGPLINRVFPLLPGAWRFAKYVITIARPIRANEGEHRPSLSIVIPARNERGNIANALRRLPKFGGAEVEVIFVEGHSTDGTWGEIERVVAEYADSHQADTGAMPDAPAVAPPWKLRVRALKQVGRGKGDAVRLGFAAASGDLVAILDADLTMPPERLVDFYDAYCEGRGDFINGDRLSLPMERGAMRPLNRLGNRFFAWALSHVLDTHLADALCGTKLFARHDWQRFIAWRADFGERDPFGDFDMLFPAAALALGCVNLPIRYAARTYGETNIQRFRDGARLLAMTVVGWWYLKGGRKL